MSVLTASVIPKELHNAWTWMMSTSVSVGKVSLERPVRSMSMTVLPILA